VLLAESLRVAHEAGALRARDLKRVTVDTTVQPKAITFPTDAKLLHAAIKGLNRLARRHSVRLRQSYSRVAKAAAMMAGRYAHAKQFRRHQRQLRILRSRLGRIIRDIRRAPPYTDPGCGWRYSSTDLKIDGSRRFATGQTTAVESRNDCVIPTVRLQVEEGRMAGNLWSKSGVGVRISVRAIG
jgi:hypothetical protein